MGEPLNHIHQDTKSAQLIAVCKRSLTNVNTRKAKSFLGAVYMSRAGPANRAELYHKNLSSLTQKDHQFELTLCFSYSQTKPVLIIIFGIYTRCQ